MSLATDLQKVAAYRTQVEIISGYNETLALLKSNGTLTPVGEMVKKLAETPSAVTDLATKLFATVGTVRAVGQVGFGYGAGSLIDTNSDPSALKTAATAIGAQLTSDIATGASAMLVFKHSKLYELIKDINVKTEDVSKFRREFNSLTKDDRKAILAAIGVNDEEADKYFKVMTDALKSILQTAIIYAGVAVSLSVASGYHGYKRSGALSALGFFLLGGTGVGLGLAQGFAKPIK